MSQERQLVEEKFDRHGPERVKIESLISNSTFFVPKMIMLRVGIITDINLVLSIHDLTEVLSR